MWVGFVTFRFDGPAVGEGAMGGFSDDLQGGPT